MNSVRRRSLLRSGVELMCRGMLRLDSAIVRWRWVDDHWLLSLHHPGRHGRLARERRRTFPSDNSGLTPRLNLRVRRRGSRRRVQRLHHASFGHIDTSRCGLSTELLALLLLFRFLHLHNSLGTDEMSRHRRSTSSRDMSRSSPGRCVRAHSAGHGQWLSPRSSHRHRCAEMRRVLRCVCLRVRLSLHMGHACRSERRRLGCGR